MEGRLLTLLVLVSVGFSHGYKILVTPLGFGFNSRLLNEHKIADILHESGHEVTLLMNNKILPHLVTDKHRLVVYQVPDDTKLITDIDLLNEGQVSLLGIFRFMKTWSSISQHFCDSFLANKTLLQELKITKFDLVLVDMIDNCARILVDFLSIPSIVYQNYGFLLETNVFYPHITSFVGINYVHDCITFPERAHNFIMWCLYRLVFYPRTYKSFNELRDKHNMNTSDVATSFSRSVVLINSDFVLEYPRPVMPNIFLISGLFHRPPNTLNDPIKSFVESSAPHGVIVLSFGTLMPTFSRDRAEIIAKVFSRLDQKIIWRYQGDPPASLANNTLLTGWFPQNDVLAHPLTKVFITHCGISSVYEAAFNAVPVIAMPLFADQHHHAQKLVYRAKMGVLLDFQSFDEQQFEWALYEILGNREYADNAKKISELLLDQPIPPRQNFLSLVNYVIRHKGAKHLISEAALKLNPFQYICLDVIVTIMLSIISLLLMSYIIGKALWWILKRTATQKIKTKWTNELRRL